MKKGIYIGLLLLSVFLLTGCLEGSISCGVDLEKRAFLHYNAQVDLSGMPETYKKEVSAAVDSLAKAYEKLDFSVEQDMSADRILLDMKYMAQEDSYAAAFKSLEKILSDAKITPFTEVKTQEEHTDREQYFFIAVQADMESIVKTMDTEPLPKDMRQALDDWINASAFTLSVSLPGQTFESENQVAVEPDNVCRAVHTARLHEKAAIDLSTRFSLSNGEMGGQTVEGQIQKFSLLRLVLFGAAGFFAAVMVTYVIYIILKSKKGSTY